MFSKLLILSKWKNWQSKRAILAHVLRHPFSYEKNLANGWIVIEIFGFSFYWMIDK